MENGKILKLARNVIFFVNLQNCALILWNIFHTIIYEENTNPQTKNTHFNLMKFVLFLA